MKWTLRILEKTDPMIPLEELQRLIWPGSETDIVPAHLLRATVQHGGLVIAAYGDSETPIGFVFGFPGFYATPDGPRLMHCSHMLGIHPLYRTQGIGFALKRAQWQMVRQQGIDLISWTYDPLLSLNAHLNIARLGAVCNTYLQNFYGAMRDGPNIGLPSDRFQVDWWVNSRRVNRRLSKRARGTLRMEQLMAAKITILNPANIDDNGLPQPAETASLPENPPDPLLLVEIPPDFPALKQANLDLALQWRNHTRALFEAVFAQGYLVTDFIHSPGRPGRSFYVLSYGESTF